MTPLLQAINDQRESMLEKGIEPKGVLIGIETARKSEEPGFLLSDIVFGLKIKLCKKDIIQVVDFIPVGPRTLELLETI